MKIKYEPAEDLQKIFDEIALLLFPHVQRDSVAIIRSFGSKSRRTIARCHALGKAMQFGMKRKGFYVIEVINPRFDRLSNKDKIKTLIHELMHIPKGFGGGFIHHNYVNEENVEIEYEKYINLKVGTEFKRENFEDKKEEKRWW